MHIQSINQTTNYLNFNGRKQKENKKVSNPIPNQTSTLKAVPLAVLMALSMGNVSSAEPNKNSSGNDANMVTTELVSANVNAPQNTETISPADKKNYDYLYEMMFGVAKGAKTNLKKTDKIWICYLKDIRDYNTDKPLGDAIIIEYKHPENKKEYDKLKNAGRNPEAADFPIEESYLIPITNDGVLVDAYKNKFLEEIEEERCARIKTDKNCFKYEKYPEPVCGINSFGYVSSKDAMNYFNYNKDIFCIRCY